MVYEIFYLVWIWKRTILGIWLRVPIIRIAHADGAAARRLGRLFTFADLMGANNFSAD